MSGNVFLEMIRIAMETVSERFVMILTLLMVFALFGWTIYDPSVLKIVGSGLFALFVFLPVLFRGNREEKKEMKG